MRRFLLLNSLFLLGLLVFVEVISRVFDWGNPSRILPTTLPEIVHIDHGSRYNAEGLGDHLGSVDSLTVVYKRFPYHVSTNREGFRGSDEIQGDRHIVLALGASNTFGSYVNDSDTYPFLLQSAFNKLAGGISPVQVLNGGVPGYGLGSVLSYLRDKGSKLKPKVVVVQMAIPLYYAEDLGGEFRKNLQSANRLRWLKDFLKHHSALISVFSRFRQAFNLTEQSERGGEPEIERLRLIAFGSQSPFAVDHWNKFETQMAELRDVVSAFGGKVYILLFPTIEQIAVDNYSTAPQEKAAEVAKRVGIGFIDPLSDLRGNDLDTLLLSWYPHGSHDFNIKEYKVEYPAPFQRTSAGDSHFSKFGNFLIAKSVLRALLDEAALSSKRMSP